MKKITTTTTAKKEKKKTFIGHYYSEAKQLESGFKFIIVPEFMKLEKNKTKKNLNRISEFSL